MNWKLKTLFPGLIPGLVLGIVATHIAIERRASDLTSIDRSAHVSVDQLSRHEAANTFSGDDWSLRHLNEESLSEPEVHTAIAIEERPIPAEMPRLQLVQNGQLDKPSAIGGDPYFVPEIPVNNVPQALPLNGVPARVINLNERDAEKIRAMVEQELSELSKAERDTWFESLKEMSEADATGVVRMWKTFGNGPNSSSILNQEFNSNFEVTKTPEKPLGEFTLGLDALNANVSAASNAIKMFNAMNAKTVGFVPMLDFTQSDPENPERLICVGVPQFQAMQFVRTGISLDVACRGESASVIEVVNDADEKFYVVSGRFFINSSKQLLTSIGGKNYFVSKTPLAIPEDKPGRMVITNDGEITLVHSFATSDASSEKTGIARFKILPVDNFLALELKEPGLFSASSELPMELWPAVPASSNAGYWLESGGVLLPVIQ